MRRSGNEGVRVRDARCGTFLRYLKRARFTKRIGPHSSGRLQYVDVLENPIHRDALLAASITVGSSEA